MLEKTKQVGVKSSNKTNKFIEIRNIVGRMYERWADKRLWESFSNCAYDEMSWRYVIDKNGQKNILDFRREKRGETLPTKTVRANPFISNVKVDDESSQNSTSNAKMQLSQLNV